MCAAMVLRPQAVGAIMGEELGVDLHMSSTLAKEVRYMSHASLSHASLPMSHGMTGMTNPIPAPSMPRKAHCVAISRCLLSGSCDVHS